jgi:ribosomal protein S18 acetylase RimI-like enzyme
MTGFTIEALGPDTWDAFAALIQRQGKSSFGPPACWCLWFHDDNELRDPDGDNGRSRKLRLVQAGRAHAALVFDGEVAVGWCQYGTPEELPNIYHRKQYLAETVQLPRYRVTCFYVDKKCRRKGVAEAALRGALELIARSGGGVVEGYPRDTGDGRKVSSSFLYSATRGMFEKAGFTYDRPKGQFNTVMTITVPAR